MDCFVALAPLRKRFALVAGNDAERVLLLNIQHREDIRSAEARALQRSGGLRLRLIRSLSSQSPQLFVQL